MPEWLQHFLIGSGTALVLVILMHVRRVLLNRAAASAIFAMVVDQERVLSASLWGARPSRSSDFTTVRDMLFAPDDYVRSTGVEILADILTHLRTPPQTAVKILSRFSGDRNNRVRANVAMAMHRFDPSAARMIALGMAESEDPFMRLSAAWLCGELKDVSLLDVLSLLAHKAGHVLRDRILRSLEAIRAFMEAPPDPRVGMDRKFGKQRRLLALSKIKMIQEKLLRSRDDREDTLEGGMIPDPPHGKSVPAGIMVAAPGADEHRFIPGARTSAGPEDGPLPEEPMDPHSFQNLKIAMELLGSQGRMGSGEVDRLRSLIHTRELEFRSKFLEIEKGKQEVLRLVAGGKSDGPAEELLPTEALIESNYLKMMVDMEDKILEINKEFKEFLLLKERLNKHLQ